MKTLYQYPTVTRILASEPLKEPVAGPVEQMKEREGVVLKLWEKPDGFYVRCEDHNTGKHRFEESFDDLDSAQNFFELKAKSLGMK